MAYLDPFAGLEALYLKQISLQPLDGKLNTFLSLHSHFTQAYFAIMAHKVIGGVLAST